MALIYSFRGMVLAFGGLLAVIAYALPEHYFQAELLLIVAVIALAAFLFPTVTLGVAIGSLILSPENMLVIGPEFMGYSTKSLQKLYVLVALVPSAIRYGIRPNANPVVIVAAITTVASFILGDLFPGVTIERMVRTAIGLSLPFIFFNVNYNRRGIDALLLLIVLMPLFSLALSFVYEFMSLKRLSGDIYTVYVQSYRGDYRLSGVNIPSYLAFFAFVSFFVSLNEALRKHSRSFYWLAAINFAIVLFSGTRMPSAAAIMLGGLTLLFAPSGNVGVKSKFGLVFAGGILATMLLVILWPNIEIRMFGANESIGINTSGRWATWGKMIEIISVNPFFGRGMGASTIALLGEHWSLLSYAHNEYLRVTLDVGLVGIILFVGAIIYLLRQEMVWLSRVEHNNIVILMLSVACYSITDNTISATPAIVWGLALGLIVARARDQAEESTSGGRRRIIRMADA